MRDRPDPARPLLIAVAILGGVGVNGAFLYGAFVRPEFLTEAFGNIVALAFMGEAMVLMVLLAIYLPRWGVTRLSPLVIIVLAMLGSLAFAVPVAMLFPPERSA